MAGTRGAARWRRARAAPALCLAAALAPGLGGCASKDPSALKSEARIAFAEGRPTDALRALRSATELAPADVETHYLLGVMALRSERPAEAETALARAHELEPNNARVLSAHGLALRAQRRYPEAERALLRSLLLRPGDASTIAALGEVYRLSGQPEQCAVRYEQFVWQVEQIDPAARDPLEQRALDTARDRITECQAAATGVTH